MRELIAITDVTEMWSDQVCIAGVNQKLDCIRPVIEGGVYIWDLYQDRKPIIFPGAKVWMDFSPADINPPHVEDLAFNPKSVEYKDAFEGRHWEILLRKTSHDSVQAIFDGNLKERRVPPGTQTRSLGTIGGVSILDLRVDSRFDKTALRMSFEDASGELHSDFPVNDLAFRGFYFHLLNQLEVEEWAAAKLNEELSKAGRTYLRLGLTRPTEVGDYEESCWVQVTGVYTFPDYLSGRNWSDFQ